MPALVALFWSGLASILGSLVGRVLLALSIQFVTYKGIDALLNKALGYATTNLTSLGAYAQFLGVMRVDEAISIVAGATLVRVTLSGLRASAITKMVHK